MLGIRIFLYCFLSVSVESKRHHEFSYRDDAYGPSRWGVTWKECNGNRQSPINLKVSLCKHRKFRLLFNKEESCKGYLVNNGHAPTFVVSMCSRRKYITGLPHFPHQEYQLAQFHFHFGPHSNWGTEHAMEGKRFSAELHMVHFNNKYRTVTEAIDKIDGIAVVAILFHEVTEQGTSIFDDFFHTYGYHIYHPGRGVKCRFNPVTILPKSNDMFYYRGSLTTPGCYESVNWLVYKERMTISKATMEFFRKVQSWHHGKPIATWSNLRPLQKFGARRLFCNFYSSKNS